MGTLNQRMISGATSHRPRNSAAGQSAPRAANSIINIIETALIAIRCSSVRLKWRGIAEAAISAVCHCSSIR